MNRAVQTHYFGCGSMFRIYRSSSFYGHNAQCARGQTIRFFQLFLRENFGCLLHQAGNREVLGTFPLGEGVIYIAHPIANIIG